MALKEIFKEGLCKRDDIFIITKINPDNDINAIDKLKEIL